MDEKFNFGYALELLKLGCKVSRAGWNGKDMWLVIAYQTKVSNLGTEQMDEEILFNKKYTNITQTLSNFIVMKTADNKLVPWLASQTDILAEDWKSEF